VVKESFGGVWRIKVFRVARFGAKEGGKRMTVAGVFVRKRSSF